MTRAFVIRPFRTKRDDAGEEIDFERVDRELIQPALSLAGIPGGTTAQIVEAGNIRKDMFPLIVEADLVICDVSLHNANVFYELGIRHALRRGHTILIRGKHVKGSPVFDISTERYLTYDNHQLPRADVEALAKTIRVTLDKPIPNDSPVLEYMPQLGDARFTAMQNVPDDLAEEIRRASASKEKGWLRLLATDLRGMRFEWSGLRLVAKGLWELGDTDFATAKWELIRERDANDVDANLALANLYDRKYRSTHQTDWLTRSDQALDRVFKARDLTSKDRAEALGNRARNAKTRWRTSLTGEDVTTRRAQATRRLLLQSYESYRQAYLADLNHFWPGLAALQMGTIASSLATEPGWKGLFEDEDDAVRKAATLSKQNALLRAGVELALSATKNDDKEEWLRMSRADFRFLTDEDPERIVRHYAEVIERASSFALDAARGQLKLFADLGVREEVARSVIAEIDRAGVDDPAPPHVVLFAGHQLDRPEQTPRFPLAAESAAKKLIYDSLRALQAKHPKIRVLASAAPGSDILCHEACVELDIESVVCLPMPREAVAALVYPDQLDGWRARYFRVLEQRKVLQLSDQDGLPRWLRVAELDPWERGSRWTLEMARSSAPKPRRAELIALWDGHDSPGERGGTAHLVRLARGTGDVDVNIIDAAPLVNGMGA